MLTDITLGQYFPGNSFIHKLDPRTKLLATLIYIIAIFFAVTPLAYGILTAFAAVVILISRVPWMLVFKSLKPIWIIVILTMLIHMFTAPGEHIVFTWKFLSVTAEGIDMGVKMAVRLILLLLFSSVLTFTTSPIVLTDGIENLLRPFKKLGVPAHELAMMMTIALRFIPTLLDETDRIMKAQTSRGADFASGNIFQRMKNMLPLLVPLFISAFRRADELAVAMEARCYRGGRTYTHARAGICRPRLSGLCFDYYTGGWPGSIALGEYMRTIKLVVAYDGSAYHGFQKQKNVQTVQNVLEEALTMLCGEKVVTAGSGRTDTGVHALAQTVTFTTNGRIPCANLVRAAASLLPEDIVVVSAEEMPEGFHARFSARWKTYHYKLLVNEHVNPFLVRYAWQLRQQLEVKAMNEAAELLLGTHDFSAFRSSGSVDTSPIKTIFAAKWQQQGEEILFRISGDGFLYHMVRNIVWSLVQGGMGKRTVQDFAAELTAQRCEFLNEPAPAQGLYLAEVGYREYPQL